MSEPIPLLWQMMSDVDDLPSGFQADWTAMCRQWSMRVDRNMLRSTYYDGRNRLKNLGIAVPDSLESAKLDEVVGWPAKAVDVLANRVRFDGFVTTGDDLDPLGLDEVLQANDFIGMLPQATRSGLTHSCSFLAVRSATPEDGIDSKVVVSFHSALYATGLWSWERHGLTAAMTILDIDQRIYADTHTLVPSEIMLYEPGFTVRIHRLSNGRYIADEPRETNMGHVPVYVLPYHQDLHRPFGRSRINREVMSLTDTAVRTMLRMEVSAEFYSSPQRYLLGAEPPAGVSGKTLTGWQAALSKMLVIGRDEDGQMPSIGQFSQMTMQPHSDMLRTLAGRFSGATGVPMAQLGVMTDSGPSSADAIAAAETELVIEARNTCDAFGGQLCCAARDMAVLNGTSPDDEALKHLKVNWRDPERPSQAAMADAVLKMVQAIPWLANSRVILEKLNFPDADITRLLSDKRKAAASSVLNDLLRSAGNAANNPDGSDGAADRAVGGGQARPAGTGQDLAADTGSAAQPAT
ncbi:Phage portal protein, SPP1 Gp6-like [Bifidobacterium ramosum]|uniref:Phage portal protein n=1 Tax=Bifidobacterium ramosum TaxID=1798158 RepID=A0A6L4X3K2_9BIFI|nr:phage portal protein [Bifidobacterium ramosum]KAB8289318.1 Phage portal protein, SPP1 Gp6-like [Bifidobacterium ramosum]NEG71021.1 phage portal protein [Bifidobacterium ramosum]